MRGYIVAHNGNDVLSNLSRSIIRLPVNNENGLVKALHAFCSKEVPMFPLASPRGGGALSNQGVGHIY